MDKVLITGSNGFVGLSLIKKLNKEFEVIEFTRKNSLEEIESIQPEYIIHCAAEIYKESLMLESNVILTYKLLEICKSLKSLKHFIYIGSSSEYGRKVSPMSELDILEPDSIYEGTKACGSILTRIYGKTYKFLTSVVRPFSLYGPNEQERKFIPKLYSLFMNDSKVNIKNGVHDWIHIDDFTDGVKLVMLKNKNSGEIFNFGTSIQSTNVEVFNIMTELLNKTIEYDLVEDINGPAGIDSNCWIADITKVTDVFDWTPKYTLKQGMQNYINYKKMETLKKLQKRILDISYHHKLGHLGSCFSTLPILIEIYENKKEDDIVILSNGHAGLAWYVILEHFCGENAEELFETHGVHPKYSEKNKILCSGGSLGQGITVGVGYALANVDKKIHIIISDGECAEGCVWESLKFIQENKIKNIEIYVNMNGYSAIGKIDVDYLSKCLTAFYSDIKIRITNVEAFKFLNGCGIEAHYKVMSQEDYESSLNELL